MSLPLCLDSAQAQLQEDKGDEAGRWGGGGGGGGLRGRGRRDTGLFVPSSWTSPGRGEGGAGVGVGLTVQLWDPCAQDWGDLGAGCALE